MKNYTSLSKICCLLYSYSLASLLSQKGIKDNPLVGLRRRQWFSVPSTTIWCWKTQWSGSKGRLPQIVMLWCISQFGNGNGLFNPFGWLGNKDIGPKSQRSPHGLISPSLCRCGQMLQYLGKGLLVEFCQFCELLYGIRLR